jgi:hypothetical protein
LVRNVLIHGNYAKALDGSWTEKMFTLVLVLNGAAPSKKGFRACLLQTTILHLAVAA